MAGSGVPILGSLYVYAPNQPAAIFFTVAYAITAAVHIWQCYRFKSWGLLGLHPVCATLFTLGYGLRVWGANNYMYISTDKTPLAVFIASQICIFVGPPFLELANYHVLGRVFQYVPYASPFNPGRVTAFFGGLMALVEGLNAAGISLSANANAKESPKKAGHNLILVALTLQVVVIFAFAYLSVAFHRRLVRARIPAQANLVKSTLTTLYLSMTLIFVRCIYRLVENSLGTTSVDLSDMEALLKMSPILRYESYFYIFEASLMLVNSVLWNARHPGPHLPRNTHIYLAQDGSEVERDDDGSDRRPPLLTMANTLMFGLLIRDDKRHSYGRQSHELHQGTASDTRAKPTFGNG
ncbi:RTA1 domain-containing protein [Colletotrichum navitas]|uniref:RTA1 domain-containing protein n=1 Tax=Colletotrichum navitas TaxID=681940 RepID=A0AAD8V8V9_9PEZI|nr:RTA1 domain-containing protein [Colletotrichum navitas]KAK1598652.1 RTA1 domain-containing protein [Colletotrichum navitas]